MQFTQDRKHLLKHSLSLVIVSVLCQSDFNWDNTAIPRADFLHTQPVLKTPYD